MNVGQAETIRDQFAEELPEPSALDRITAEIVEDASDRAHRYLDESIVPEGGE